MPTRTPLAAPLGPKPGSASLKALVERQHGVIARRQLVAAGLTAKAIRVRLERGDLIPLHRGVYAVGHARLTQRGRWMAAVLASGPTAVLSHRDAAALWGIRPCRRSLIEVTVAKWRTAPAAVQLHTSPVRSDERTTRDAIPVTTAFRTLLDLAAVLDERALTRAVNEAERQALGDSISLTELLQRHERRPGTAKLRKIQPTTRLTRSSLERAFLAYCEKHRIALPQTNITIEGYEVDCVWREHRLIAELDGYEHHRTRLDLVDDGRRDHDLLAAGWRVIRIRAEHLATTSLAGRLQQLTGS